MDRHFEIGIITKPVGVRGQVRVLPTTDDAGRYALLIGEAVTVGGAPLTLAEARLQKGMVVAKFAEVNDRDAAEKLAGSVITIPPEMAVPLAEGEHFVRDIVGREIVDEGGEVLGVLSQVIHGAAHDIYVVKPDGGRAFMLPAVREVVLHVGDEIRVRLAPGMEELYI